jgi:hypothetical protein
MSAAGIITTHTRARSPIPTLPVGVFGPVLNSHGLTRAADARKRINPSVVIR